MQQAAAVQRPGTNSSSKPVLWARANTDMFLMVGETRAPPRKAMQTPHRKARTQGPLAANHEGHAEAFSDLVSKIMVWVKKTIKVRGPSWLQ